MDEMPSDYEAKRAERIKENRHLLESLNIQLLPQAPEKPKPGKCAECASVQLVWGH